MVYLSFKEEEEAWKNDRNPSVSYEKQRVNSYLDELLRHS